MDTSIKFYILLFIIALLAVKIYHLEYKLSTMKRENMTDSLEGIDSIVSMFNNGVIKATSIETTGDIKCGGNLTGSDISGNKLSMKSADISGLISSGSIKSGPITSSGILTSNGVKDTTNKTLQLGSTIKMVSNYSSNSYLNSCGSDGCGVITRIGGPNNTKYNKWTIKELE